MKKATRFLAIWIAVFAVIIGAVIAANCIAIYWDQALVQALGVVGEGVSEDTTGNVGDTQYFKRSYTDEQLTAAQEEFVERAAGEGIVMLKNGDIGDSKALPLEGNEKVSMFGIASTQSVASGSGSGSVVSDSASSYYGSLTAAGFDVNTTLRDFYAECGHSRGNGTSTGGGADMGDWHLDEVHPNDIPADARSSISSYNDVAVVVFARGSGEGGDLPYEMSRHGGSADEHYLELDADERALLEYVETLGFDRTIVLINSGNTFETGFVDDASTAWTRASGIPAWEPTV